MNKLQPFSDTVTLLSGGRVMREVIPDEVEDSPARHQDSRRIPLFLLAQFMGIILLMGIIAG